ncbi:MAG: YigZ family protein [Lachnospiraceae bacterium]|nr:YigZ family protein [Lachnospiraceae bacterium]
MGSVIYLHKGGQGEIEVKKSRFISSLNPAANEEEAQAFINEIKKKYWDARHNCSAFVIGDKGELTRCSDDGEPSGTAGRPMLEVLKGSGVRNAVVTVTRYFGGVLLGTGGLVRAYSDAVREGLNNSVIIEMTEGVLACAKMDYTDLSRLQYIFSAPPFTVKDTVYEDKVEFSLLLPREEFEAMGRKVLESTGGRVELESKGLCRYGKAEGELICNEL